MHQQLITSAIGYGFKMDTGVKVTTVHVAEIAVGLEMEVMVCTDLIIATEGVHVCDAS